MKKGEIEEDLEKLRADIRKKGEEIERLKKTVEELSARIRGKEEKGKTTELSDMIGEVSELLEAGFNIFGISSRGRGMARSDGGLVGLINNLARLAEKSESFQRKFDLNGKEGVIDFRIHSGPIKRTHGRRRRLYTKKPLIKGVETRQESFAPAAVKPIEEREPIVDIFEDEETVTVMAELPGVTEKDIEWDVEGGTLTIKTNISERKYYKEIDLPKAVEKKGAKSTYRNGILEIKMRKTPTERTNNR